MTLSDIKFKYEEKIQNLDSRIERYQSIINDYDNTLQKAEKEENPNISSVLTSKKEYEHKIKNMLRVREYYQEFVDSADYLMQNLNNETQFKLISQNEVLRNRVEFLEQENDELREFLEEKNMELKRKGIQVDISKKKLRKLRENNRIVLNNVKEENKSLKEGNKIVKKLKKDIKKLSDENTMLLDTNDFLERKCEKLEDYCNNLLNRKGVVVE